MGWFTDVFGHDIQTITAAHNIETVMVVVTSKRLGGPQTNWWTMLSRTNGSWLIGVLLESFSWRDIVNGDLSSIHSDLDNVGSTPLGWGYFASPLVGWNDDLKPTWPSAFCIYKHYLLAECCQTEETKCNIKSVRTEVPLTSPVALLIQVQVPTVRSFEAVQQPEQDSAATGKRDLSQVQG